MGDPGAPAPSAGSDGAGAVGETLATFLRVHVAGLFEAEISERPEYRLCIDWDGVIQETEDPYSVPPLLGELDVYLLAEGRHHRIAECLGAQPMTCEGAPGVRFAVCGVADMAAVRDWPRLNGSALDDALNTFAHELDARDDVHATARYRRDLVRLIGRDLVRDVLQ